MPVTLRKPESPAVPAVSLAKVKTYESRDTSGDGYTLWVSGSHGVTLQRLVRVNAPGGWFLPRKAARV